jgi:hypothetical protein
MAGLQNSVFGPKKASSNVCGTPGSNVTAEYIASTTSSSPVSSFHSTVLVQGLGLINPGSVVAS